MILSFLGALLMVRPTSPRRQVLPDMALEAAAAGVDVNAPVGGQCVLGVELRVLVTDVTCVLVAVVNGEGVMGVAVMVVTADTLAEVAWDDVAEDVMVDVAVVAVVAVVPFFGVVATVVVTVELAELCAVMEADVVTVELAELYAVVEADIVTLDVNELVAVDATVAVAVDDTEAVTDDVSVVAVWDAVVVAVDEREVAAVNVAVDITDTDADVIAVEVAVLVALVVAAHFSKVPYGHVVVTPSLPCRYLKHMFVWGSMQGPRVFLAQCSQRCSVTAVLVPVVVTVDATVEVAEDTADDVTVDATDAVAVDATDAVAVVATVRDTVDVSDAVAEDVWVAVADEVAVVMTVAVTVDVTLDMTLEVSDEVAVDVGDVLRHKLHLTGQSLPMKRVAHPSLTEPRRPLQTGGSSLPRQRDDVMVLVCEVVADPETVVVAVVVRVLAAVSLGVEVAEVVTVDVAVV